MPGRRNSTGETAEPFYDRERLGVPAAPRFRAKHLPLCAAKTGTANAQSKDYFVGYYSL